MRALEQVLGLVADAVRDPGDGVDHPHVVHVGEVAGLHGLAVLGHVAEDELVWGAVGVVGVRLGGYDQPVVGQPAVDGRGADQPPVLPILGVVGLALGLPMVVPMMAGVVHGMGGVAPSMVGVLSSIVRVVRSMIGVVPSMAGVVPSMVMDIRCMAGEPPQQFGFIDLIGVLEWRW